MIDPDLNIALEKICNALSERWEIELDHKGFSANEMRSLIDLYVYVFSLFGNKPETEIEIFKYHKIDDETIYSILNTKSKRRFKRALRKLEECYEQGA